MLADAKEMLADASSPVSLHQAIHRYFSMKGTHGLLSPFIYIVSLNSYHNSFFSKHIDTE